MKYIISSFLFFISMVSLAQSDPFYVTNYQATVREAGQPLVNETFDVRFTLYLTDGSGIGYREVHEVTTNDFGGFSALIGEGDALDGFIGAMGRSSELEVEIDRGDGFDSFGVSTLAAASKAHTANFIANSYLSIGEPFLIFNNDPVISVGGIGSVGGSFWIGNEDQFAILECGDDDPFGAVLNVSNAGSGQGLHLRGNHLKISSEVDPTTAYSLDIETGSTEFGFVNRNSDLSSNWEQYVSLSGNLFLYANGTNLGSFDQVSGAYTSISDAKTKTDVTPMTGALAAVMNLAPQHYRFKANNPTGRRSIGFIAQDVKEVLPELVFSNEGRNGDESTLTMDYSGFGVVAVAAIQEQQAQIDALKEVVDALKAEVELLKAQ